ncbi:uncharacterized protein LOC118231025 [Anguilla anguilla]|uniref:uncharacterized protein LOC118231025 n=1 Tax=Anguilla anguilla TaxID=7936 RepID=UPI0015AA6C6F|nr:uncharacterized protein LOC118231025 [Anguilla anguilla]XP_035280325.1 uncharacterized protein LOC118231025 [Anguilla anguilla]XP_035280326.1 uncharacterized protein LOC118231025 [Anguilla anguilla]XP_035280327.1 uncharacterized protein LOC118231025 [Anguilla anguilla]
MQDSKQQYEENIGKLLTRFGKGSPEARRKAEQALSLLLKSVGMLAKADSVFATTAPYHNFILAFVPQDLPDVTLTKKQFVEVNRKLDSISLKVLLLLTAVQWSCYASEYSEAEAEIENAWEKFTEFINSKFSQEEDKVKCGQLLPLPDPGGALASGQPLHHPGGEVQRQHHCRDGVQPPLLHSDAEGSPASTVLPHDEGLQQGRGQGH